MWLSLVKAFESMADSGRIIADDTLRVEAVGHTASSLRTISAYFDEQLEETSS